MEYIFLQVFVDRPILVDAQTCGNILAGVAPFAIERGLVAARDGEAPVVIFMQNTGQRWPRRGCRRPAAGSLASARDGGVPGEAAPVPIAFRETAGSTCGALLPSGNTVDLVEGGKSP